MNEWPKFNTERHGRLGSETWCVTCATGYCYPDSPCRCCETARADEAEKALHRVREQVKVWRADDTESLMTWGQHESASLAILADQIDAALDGPDA